MEITRTPWLLTPLDVGLEIRPRGTRTFIFSIVFSLYTDPAHRCRIIDGSGRDVYDQRGDFNNDPIIVPFPCNAVYNGLTMVQLDSGQCHIHIR